MRKEIDAAKAMVKQAHLRANPKLDIDGTRQIPPGKDNPIGTRWVGLTEKGFGIHGTNAPKSIGHAASHGCIRLRNRDMERLFDMLRVGDLVEIRGERDEETAEIFGGEADKVTLAAAQTGSMQADGGQ